MTMQLTPAQHAILAYAHQHTDGKIVWFPDHIKGGARKKVLDGLSNRALITSKRDDWFIAAEGYDALGVPRKAPVSEEKHGAPGCASQTGQARRRARAGRGIS